GSAEHVAGDSAGDGAWHCFIGRFAAAAAALAALTIGAGLTLAKPPCAAPKELVSFSAPLTHLVQAFRSKTLIRIVALGSSSTAGSGASSPHASYPAQLDDELERRFEKHDFKVTNLGVGGQLASEMLDRMQGEVIPREPDLVLW